MITPMHFLAVSVLLFTAGSMGVLLRRDALGVFMCIELMLNGVSLAFVTFSRMHQDFSGQVFVLVVLAVAASEAAIGLALMIAYSRSKRNVDLKEMNILKG